MPKITPADEHRFTRGDCHVLARAINLLTGWPIYAFNHRGLPCTHAFVMLPDGRVLDVQGVSSTKELYDRWRWASQPDESIPTTWRQLSDCWGRYHFNEYSFTRAQQIAPLLVEQAQRALREDRPPQVTDEDIERFTDGDCHLLARALQRKTGWPIHSFWDADGFPDMHAFVVMPDGRALDVQGAHSLDELAVQWHSDDLKIEPTDWKTLAHHWGTGNHGSRRRASAVARLLLEAANCPSASASVASR